MTARSRSQQLNPMLGIYFGIFVASLLASILLVLILEQLGVAEDRLRALFALGTIGLYAAVGIAGYTNESAGFLLAHRRVPAFFAGLALALGAIGGTGLMAFSGALFLVGFDALCLPLGIMAGFVAMAILLAPFLRKFGAPTVPGYIGLRFGNPLLRLVAASLAAVPLILLIIAEFKVALIAAGWLLPGSDGLIAFGLAVALIAMLTPGGARSLSWSSAAQGVATLLAVLIPATIIAVIATNLPLGQLSHGPVLRLLGRTELAQGLPASIATALTFELPHQAMQPISGRFATPFGNVGSVAFVLAMLCVMAGIAGSPGHLGRTSVTPSVYETRKSIGWAVFVTGVVIMTISANAVFFRDILMNQIAGVSASNLPLGLRALIAHGIAVVDPSAGKLTATSVAFQRDGTVLGLPILLGFPNALVLLVSAGVLSAAFAGAAASINQLGLIIGEDVVIGLPGEPPAASVRMQAARIAMAVMTMLAAWCAAIASRDPLDLMLWSLALSGATFFPVLVLSIWWKRINAWGAFAGMSSGFGVTLVCLIAGVFDLTRFPEELSAAFGIPIAFGAAIGVSLFTPAPGRHILEMVRDLRVPGGETLHDRELRLQRQKRAQNA